MTLCHHLQRSFAVQSPFCDNADLIQGVNCAFTKLEVIVYDQHVPVGQYHFFLRYCCLFQIQRDMEFRPLAQFTLYLDHTVHRVYDILRDCHAKAGAFCLMYALCILADKGLENAFLEILGHANAGILYINMYTHIILTNGGGLFVHGEADRAAFRCKFYSVRQKVQQYLIDTHAVTEYIFGFDIMDENVKLLIFCFDLRLDDIDNAVHHLTQGYLVHGEHQFPAFDFGHIQNIVYQAKQMLAGKRDFPQAVLHLLCIADIRGGNCRHADDGIHRRPDIMAHVGKEFTLCLVRTDSVQTGIF